MQLKARDGNPGENYERKSIIINLKNYILKASYQHLLWPYETLKLNPQQVKLLIERDTTALQKTAFFSV